MYVLDLFRLSESLTEGGKSTKKSLTESFEIFHQKQLDLGSLPEHGLRMLAGLLFSRSERSYVLYLDHA